MGFLVHGKNKTSYLCHGWSPWNTAVIEHRKWIYIGSNKGVSKKRIEVGIEQSKPNLCLMVARSPTLPEKNKTKNQMKPSSITGTKVWAEIHKKKSIYVLNGLLAGRTARPARPNRESGRRANRPGRFC